MQPGRSPAGACTHRARRCRHPGRSITARTPAVMHGNLGRHSGCRYRAGTGDLRRDGRPP